MRNLRRSLAVLVLASPLALPLVAASENDEPKPIPVTADSGNSDMPLELYRSLRGQWSAIFETAPEVPEVLSDVPETLTEEPSEPKPAKVVVPPEQKLQQLREMVQSHAPEILAALHAKQAIQRELAAKVLVLSDDKKAAVAGLATVLTDDSDATVRRAAAASLNKLRDAEACDALLAGLKDDSEDVRAECVTALGSLKDDRAIEPLLQILRSDSKPLIRMHAAISLGRIKTGVDEKALSTILESETDERVKMAIAAALRVLTGTEAALADVPEHTDFQKQLHELSTNMKDVEQKMRDDRHDETVQVDQKGIDDKLGDMIRELEKAQQIAQIQKEQSEREKDKQRRLAMMGRNRSSERSNRPANSPGNSAPSDSAMNPRNVIGRNERWASLPPKDRDELLQVFRPEVPLRWRKRLEAYFVSIAAEEAKASQNENRPANEVDQKPAPAPKPPVNKDGSR